MMGEIIYKDESYAIVGACFEVYKEMGVGFSKPSIRNVWKSNWTFRASHFVRDRSFC